MTDALRNVVYLQQALGVGDPETFRSDYNVEDETGDHHQYIVKHGDTLYWITSDWITRYRLVDGTEVEID